jgi:hypothetical protein
MSVATTARPPRGLRARAGGMSRTEWVLMAILVLVPVVLTWRFAHGSFFFGDDLFNLYQAHHARVGLEYAFGEAIGHLAPGYRLAYTASDRLFPFDFGIALGFLIACQVASAVLMQRIFTLVFGRAWWTYALALAWAISIVYLPAFDYFAAGILSITSIAATLASIHAYLCWRVTRKPAWLVWSLVAMVLGLLFYTKVLLVPVYLVLMRLMLLEPQTRLRDSLRSVLREWRVWLAYALVIAGYLVIYLTGPYERLRGGSSLSQILEYLGTLWTHGFWPMVIGVRVPQFGQTTGEQIAVWAVQAGLVLLVAWSIVRRRSAWRAWFFLVVGILLNALMVVGRVSEWGADSIAYYFRYYTEPEFLVPLAIAFAFAMPRLGSKEAREGPFRMPKLWAGIAAAVVFAAYLGATLATTEDFSKPYVAKQFSTNIESGRRARGYFDNLRGDLAAARKRGETPSLVDGDVPEWVQGQFANLGSKRTGVRYTALSTLVPLFDDHVPFLQPPNLFVVQPTGHLTPTRFVPAAGGDVATLLRKGRFTYPASHVEGPADRATNGEYCVAANNDGGGSVNWEPVPHLAGKDWALRMTYRTEPLNTPFGLADNAGLGFGKYKPTIPPMFKPGTALAGLDELPTGIPTAAGVSIAIPPHGKICLRSLEIGSFVPPVPKLKPGN